MDKETTRVEILKLLDNANKLIPHKLIPDLTPSKELMGENKWHDFEFKIWEIGEQIRKLRNQFMSLRNDEELNMLILEICLNQKAKRGRQSFVMLMWYKQFQKYSVSICSLLGDKYIYGHILETLNKIGISGCQNKVKNFVNDDKKWIKKQAIKYIEKYGT